MVFAILVLVAAGLSGARFPRWWLALTLAGTAAFLGAALGPLGGGIEWDWRSGFALGGERLHLRLDAVSAWFLALVAAVGVLVIFGSMR
jgi:hydrogenase-4 component B